MELSMSKIILQNIMKHKTIFTLFLSLFLFGCFSLDDNLFNATKLTSYNLSTAIIPEAKRTQVILNSQGKKIYGYFVESNGEKPNYTILYFHGNKDHIQFYWDRVELFYKMGYNIFIIDYQGFGMSEGTSSEEALYSDAKVALQYIRSRGNIADTSIALYGFSLGCAAAIHLAANEFTPRVLIAEAPFASATALVQSGVVLDIPNSYVMDGEYNNAEKIKNVSVPLLLLHGESDTFIDIDKNSKVIYENANEPKKFIRIPNAGHSTIPSTLGDSLYKKIVTEFVESKK